MVAQPGVYWYLNTPFLDIIGLYSNIGEGPGFISGPIPGPAQKAWLIKTLQSILSLATDAPKGLLLAVHHPPFSSGGHSSSTEMLADIDDACQQAGIYPDVVLAAHSHNYQRYTRHITASGQNTDIPYYVVGTGGRGLNPVTKATGVRTGDCTFESSLSGYGYLTLKASHEKIELQFTEVGSNGKKSLFDQVVTVKLHSKPKSGMNNKVGKKPKRPI